MATIKLELSPFPVPTSVAIVMPRHKKEGAHTRTADLTPVIALSDLSDEALEALIEEFATNVMASARPVSITKTSS